MRAVLTTQIPVHRVAAFAEMAWLERRPELGLICRAAREGAQRIDQRAVQAVLPALSEAGRKNVIQWCQSLGLCDRSAALTELGRKVADSDEAPVPEQGTYGLWLATHPVIGRRVLAASRLSSSREQRLQELRALPFLPETDEVFCSTIDPNERFQVRALPEDGRGLVYGEGGRCELRWTLDFDKGKNSWQLSGALSQPKGKHHEEIPIIHDPKSEDLDLWALMEHWGAGPLRQFGEWCIQKRRLAVGFQNLPDDVQERFRASVKLDEVEVPNKGTYSNVLLEDVPLAPLKKTDAQQWAMARLKRQLDKAPTYRSRAALRDLFVGLVEETPLADFAPTLPAHDDLPGALDASPAQRWLLRAPVDLALHPVPAELLASLQVAAEEATTAAPAARGTLRIPYQSGWSMRRLTDALLEGAQPRRVLLCDRYVRGDENLASLGLLISALRAAAPAVTVDIWTDEEGGNLNKIKEITGVAPRKFVDVFGKDVPHDRYLLVQTSGDRFGWHLSNSPLHARPLARGAAPDIDASLRWRELLGGLTSLDELMSPLRQWLSK